MSTQKLFFSSCQTTLLALLLTYINIVNAASSPPTLKPTLTPTRQPSSPSLAPTPYFPTYHPFVKPPTPLSDNAVAAAGIVVIIVVVIPVSIVMYCIYHFCCGSGRSSVDKVLASMQGKGDKKSSGTKDIEAGPAKKSRREQAALEVEK